MSLSDSDSAVLYVLYEKQTRSGAGGEQRKQCVHNGLVTSSGNGVLWGMTGAKCGKLVTSLKFHV